MSSRPVGRLDIFHAWPEGFQAMQALESAIAQTGLEPGLLELVRIRASQLNGCAFCLAMHAKAAVAHSEDPLTLIQLDAWRDTTYYSARERAALALTEQITQCGGGVTDETIEAARIHFSATELAQLVYAATAINAWNRLAIADRTPTRT